MRPRLKPALHRVWRDATTLQLGLDPQRAVVISGLDDAGARLVESLDGSRDLPTLLADAATSGLDKGRAGRIVDLLHGCGVLDDGLADRRPLRRLQHLDRERLAPDLAAASLVRADHDAGVEVLARRQAVVVAVHGAGRIGAPLASLLAAAGVGTLVLSDEIVASPADLAPGGLSADDLGARRQDGAARAARTAGPGLRLGLPRGRSQPDLAVVTATDPVTAGIADDLVRSGVPHLFASVREGTGIVGPLVVPGRSSCHRCHDLYRSDRDPAWPNIAAQLMTGTGARTPACDVALAAAVTAHSALQVLAYVDGDATPPTFNGTIEIEQADGRVRRRSWCPHPLCGCRWAEDEPVG